MSSLQTLEQGGDGRVVKIIRFSKHLLKVKLIGFAEDWMCSKRERGVNIDLSNGR